MKNIKDYSLNAEDLCKMLAADYWFNTYADCLKHGREIVIHQQDSHNDPRYRVWMFAVLGSPTKVVGMVIPSRFHDGMIHGFCLIHQKGRTYIRAADFKKVSKDTYENSNPRAQYDNRGQANATTLGW